MIRPVRYRDLDAIDELTQQSPERELPHCSTVREKGVSIRNWYGVLRFLSLLPNPLQSLPCVHVAELNQKIQGVIQVSPFNRTRSTWRVDRVVVAPAIVESDEETSQVLTRVDIGSLLIRFCLERIWQARTLGTRNRCQRQSRAGSIPSQRISAAGEYDLLGDLG